jgi:hypothetical protein
MNALPPHPPAIIVPAAALSRIYKVVVLADPTFTAIQQAPGGVPILVSGLGFGTGGMLTVGNVTIPTTTWQDGVIVATLPEESTDVVGILTVTPTGGAPLALPQAFTISAKGPPTPPPPPPVAGPQITQFLDMNGQPIVVGHPDERVAIVGTGFGTKPGTLLWMGLPLTPLLWTDTRIEVILTVGPPPVGEFTVTTTDEGYFAGSAFPIAP